MLDILEQPVCKKLRRLLLDKLQIERVQLLEIECEEKEFSYLPFGIYLDRPFLYYLRDLLNQLLG